MSVKMIFFIFSELAAQHAPPPPPQGQVPQSYNAPQHVHEEPERLVHLYWIIMSVKIVIHVVSCNYIELEYEC